MKLIYTSLTVFFFITSTIGLAQKNKTDANIVGEVQCNGQPVPFANVTIDGTTIGTSTDASGNFQMMNMPIGSLMLRVSCINYKGKAVIVVTEAGTTKEIKVFVEEDLLNLEEIVVSADRNKMNRKEAPVVVKSILPKIFENTQSINIAEGLAFTPGLRTENDCQNCGFTQLRMNGMEGPYTQILMNSRPVFSGLAGIYGLELIPANMVERLEVVRGGGSSLFGGNAIAGTVNIITKEPTRNTFSVNGRVGVIGVGDKGADVAKDSQLNLNASFVSSDDKTGAYTYAMFRDKGAYDKNNDGFSESVKMNNSTFGFSVYHKPTTKSKLTLDGYRVNEFRRGGNNLDNLPHKADIAEQVKHLITGANLSYDLFVNSHFDKLTIYATGQHVDRESYYGAFKDENGYGHTTDFTSSVGSQYIINADKFLFAESSTIFGIENNNTTLKDVKLGINNGNNTTLTYQMVNTLGTFFQHDWRLKRVNLSVGMRFDNYLVRDLHDEDENPADDVKNKVLAPRVSAIYKITPNLKLRGSYAKGYRAPQIFNEDLHIALINARRVIHINDKGLVEETSHSFSASLDYDFAYQSILTDILVEGFYTNLINAFADEYYELDDQGSWAYRRVNADGGANIMGLNFEVNTQFSTKFDAQIGYTVQKSQYEKWFQWGQNDGDVTKKFLRSPNQYGYATFTWYSSKQLSTVLTFNYTGSMYVPHFGLKDPNQEFKNDLTLKQLAFQALERGDVISGERLEFSEKFLLVDFLVKYKFSLTNETKMQFTAGVKNIFNQSQNVFDTGMFRDAGYIYGPFQPRMVNIGVKIGNII